MAKAIGSLVQWPPEAVGVVPIDSFYHQQHGVEFEDHGANECSLPAVPLSFFGKLGRRADHTGPGGEDVQRLDQGTYVKVSRHKPQQVLGLPAHREDNGNIVVNFHIGYLTSILRIPSSCQALSAPG